MRLVYCWQLSNCTLGEVPPHLILRMVETFRQQVQTAGGRMDAAITASRWRISFKLWRWSHHLPNKLLASQGERCIKNETSLPCPRDASSTCRHYVNHFWHQTHGRHWMIYLPLSWGVKQMGYLTSWCHAVNGDRTKCHLSRQLPVPVPMLFQAKQTCQARMGF